MYSSVTTYGGGSVKVGEVAKSGTMLADLSPALLWPLPRACSLRDRLGGRADTGVGPFAVGGFDCCRAIEGVRCFVGTDGDGDEREDMPTPFVWMDAGMGRPVFIFEEVDATGTPGGMTIVGAMLMGLADCQSRPRRLFDSDLDAHPGRGGYRHSMGL